MKQFLILASLTALAVITNLTPVPARASENSPLCAAVISNDIATVTKILDAGAGADDRCNLRPYTAGQSLYRSPLYIALEMKNYGIGQALIDHGADPNFESWTKLCTTCAAKGESNWTQVLVKGSEQNLVTMIHRHPQLTQSQLNEGLLTVMRALPETNRVAKTKALLTVGANPYQAELLKATCGLGPLELFNFYKSLWDFSKDHVPLEIYFTLNMNYNQRSLDFIKQLASAGLDFRNLHPWFYFETRYGRALMEDIRIGDYLLNLNIPFTPDEKQNSFLIFRALDTSTPEQVIEWKNWQIKAAKELLDRGVKPNKDALVGAVAQNLDEIIRTFVKMGISINFQFLNKLSQQTDTPLTYAISSEPPNEETILTLISLGGDVNATAQLNGGGRATPLCLARRSAWNISPRVIQALRDKGGKETPCDPQI